MYHHRLTISYKGTNYFGWQDTGTSEDKPTIEASIHQVLKKICKYQESSIHASSRTDAGVHAQGQVLKVSIAINITSEKLLLGMNSLLSNDIRVLHCTSCAEAFNTNKDSKSKAYHYLFCTDSIHNPVLNDTVAHIPSSTSDPLDIALMKEGCKLFAGKHDFYSFAKRDTTLPLTVRTVLSCEIVQAHSHLGNEVYIIKIIGTGFFAVYGSVCYWGFVCFG